MESLVKCFFFVFFCFVFFAFFFSGDWYRAKSKYLIISAAVCFLNFRIFSMHFFLLGSYLFSIFLHAYQFLILLASACFSVTEPLPIHPCFFHLWYIPVFTFSESWTIPTFLTSQPWTVWHMSSTLLVWHLVTLLQAVPSLSTGRKSSVII